MTDTLRPSDRDDFPTTIVQVIEFIRATTAFAGEQPGTPAETAKEEVPESGPAMAEIGAAQMTTSNPASTDEVREMPPELMEHSSGAVAPEPKDLSLAAGLGVMWSPVGLPVSAVATVSAHYAFSGPLSAHVTIAVPVHTTQIERPQTSITSYPGVLCAGVAARINLAADLALLVSGGGGPIWFNARGQQRNGLEPLEGTAWSFAVRGGLTGAWWMQSWLELQLDVSVGAAPSHPVLTLDDKIVASWGRPFFVGSVSAAFHFPPKPADDL